MQHTLVAVFDNRTDAQNAMNELLSSNYSRENVRLSSSDTTGMGDSGTTTATGTTHADQGIGSSIKNFFSDLFSDDASKASRYESAVSGGRHVLTLSADSLPEVERAADIVERYGPVDIDEHSDAGKAMAGMGMSDPARMGSSGLQQSSPLSAQSASRQDSLQRTDSLQRAEVARDTATRSIPVVEEQLQVGKREAQRGGVRIFSRIVETPVNETIGLREEHVKVERHRVDQPINPADATAFKEQTIEMRETAEEAVVQKSARVVEEVTVGKQVKQRQEQIHDTVRRTEVEVERLGAEGLRDDDSYYRSHFSSNYGSSGAIYDDYAPAYSYGTQMRGDTRYANRQWDDVESDLRTDWESRNRGGGLSAWEKVKAAVRHGWDRMTDDHRGPLH